MPAARFFTEGVANQVNKTSKHPGKNNKLDELRVAQSTRQVISRSSWHPALSCGLVCETQELREVLLLLLEVLTRRASAWWVRTCPSDRRVWWEQVAKALAATTRYRERLPRQHRPSWRRRLCALACLIVSLVCLLCLAYFVVSSIFCKHGCLVVPSLSAGIIWIAWVERWPAARKR